MVVFDHAIRATGRDSYRDRYTVSISVSAYDKSRLSAPARFARLVEHDGSLLTQGVEQVDLSQPLSAFINPLLQAAGVSSLEEFVKTRGLHNVDFGSVVDYLMEMVFSRT